MIFISKDHANITFFTDNRRDVRPHNHHQVLLRRFHNCARAYRHESNCLPNNDDHNIDFHVVGQTTDDKLHDEDDISVVCFVELCYNLWCLNKSESESDSLGWGRDKMRRMDFNRLLGGALPVSQHILTSLG